MNKLRVVRANKLLQGLEDEQMRWTKEVKTIKEEIN